MSEMQRCAVANGLSSFLVKFGSLTIALVFVVMMRIGSKTKSMMLIFTMACTIVGGEKTGQMRLLIFVTNKTFLSKYV